MIRSSRIPPLLNKVCTDGILSCYLITSDGELLGCSDAHLSLDASKNSASPSSSWGTMDPNDVSALVAEVVEDYKRLGLELALLNTSNQQGVGGSGSTVETAVRTLSHQSSASDKVAKDKDRGRLNSLIVEMEKGLVGIATATASTYVVAITDSTAQHGYLKMKMTLLANHVRDAFSPLEDNTVVS